MMSPTFTPASTCGPDMYSYCCTLRTSCKPVDDPVEVNENPYLGEPIPCNLWHYRIPLVVRNVPFCSIWNAKRTFLTVKLLLYLLFGYHGNSYSCDLYRKWAQLVKHVTVSYHSMQSWSTTYLYYHNYQSWNSTYLNYHNYSFILYH